MINEEKDTGAVRPALVCPICRQPLEYIADEKRMACRNRHSFDISRKGYINLLPSNKKNSKIPGDSPEMVHARTSFLEKGYYRGFSDGINSACTDVFRDFSLVRIVDAGCGEGYYTGRLAGAFEKNGIKVTAAGFDLSKDAIAHAASATKNDPSFAFCVASLFDMPVPDKSADIIVNLFAPVADGEFARVLSDNGLLLIAVPAEEHLFGLKSAIYDNPYKNETRRDILSSFVLEKVHNITYTITLRSNSDIMNLFAMTPYFWKTSVSDKARLSLLDTLDTVVSFDLLLYRKKPAAAI